MNYFLEIIPKKSFTIYENTFFERKGLKFE
jgi:hypothetical protein